MPSETAVDVRPPILQSRTEPLSIYKTSRPRIHLINRFQHVAGSELRALGLARILSPHADVRVWSTGVPDPRLTARMPIEEIDVRRGRFPRTGTFVFVGVYYWLGRWVRLTRPSRRIIVYNTPEPERFETFERATARTLTLRTVPCEIVYASELIRPALGRPGIVEESPIDIVTFQPRGGQADGRTFRVGRFSRAVPEKFHENDAALYGRLAQHGIDVHLMGGTCLDLAPSARITVTPSDAAPAVEFLRTLDCFVYRTRSDWLETFARVVFEAMACGLPVVVGSRGGYARYIVHGHNGLLFDTTEEAIGHVLRLRDDPALRARLGRNARQTVESIYSEGYERKLVDFYTGRRVERMADFAAARPSSRYAARSDEEDYRAISL